jgi:hypothetical protein
MVGLVEYNGKKYIASILDYGIGHPMCLETGTIDAGGYYFDTRPNAKPITMEQYELWKSKYEEFHEMVLEEDGFDMCEEKDISPLLRYKC